MKNRILLAAIGLISVVALIQTTLELVKLSAARAQAPYFFSGTKFDGLAEFLKGERAIGYWTDRDLTNDKVGAQYTQAQLVLAPIILDVGSTDHHFVLFDGTNGAVLMAKMNEVGAVPLKHNNFGIMLAVRPEAKP